MIYISEITFSDLVHCSWWSGEQYTWDREASDHQVLYVGATSQNKGACFWTICVSTPWVESTFSRTQRLKVVLQRSVVILCTFLWLYITILHCLVTNIYFWVLVETRMPTRLCLWPPGLEIPNYLLDHSRKSGDQWVWRIRSWDRFLEAAIQMCADAEKNDCGSVTWGLITLWHMLTSTQHL
jgi:hypothetical protein